METYRIVIPSRGRAKNMPRMLRLLPGATVCVAQSERPDYEAAVPEAQLLCHQDLPGLVAIRNWLNATVQEDCLVEVDDDLRCVRSLVGRQRKVTEPEVIRRIIENSLQVCADLDLGVFCWSRTRNTFLCMPELHPVRVVQPISSSFGLRGRARQRRFDESAAGRADLDFTLRTLLEDRILYADMRWYFDHGRMFSGLGGNVGLISSNQFERSTQTLSRRWGSCIGQGKPGFHKAASYVSSMSIHVERQNPIVRANLEGEWL